MTPENIISEIVFKANQIGLNGYIITDVIPNQNGSDDPMPKFIIKKNIEKQDATE